MTPAELVAQIGVCKRRAKNAENFVRIYKYDNPPDLNKVRYWEAEASKQMQYVKELEEELAELESAAA